MVVRELVFTEMQRLKNYTWWTEKNNLSKLTKDVRSGFVHLYGVVHENRIVATLKMSGKCTVLGREIAQAAAQIYGVTVNDTLDNGDEVSQELVRCVLEELHDMGYKQVVVLYSEDNERTKALCKEFEITDVIGNIRMENGKGELKKYTIVCGSI